MSSALSRLTWPALRVLGGAVVGVLLGLSLPLAVGLAAARVLGVVGVAAWLLGSILNLALGRTDFAVMFGQGLLDFVLAVLVGGLVSLVVVRPPADSTPEQP